MYGQIVLKDIFSLFNILLIVYLLADRKQNLSTKKTNWYSFLLCIASIFLVRVMENSLSLHVVYHYITIWFSVLIIGHFLLEKNAKYCIIIGSIFLSVILSGQLLSCICLYPYGKTSILAELPAKYQFRMILIAETVIVICSITMKKIVVKIPSILNGLNVVTIMAPLLINIVVMAIGADQLYYEKEEFMNNIYSLLTVMATSIVMFAGMLCNIVILENYLNVKKIENEKKLQISEMSLQYDYYVRQSYDMENVRRLSHDIKNHLEALKENIDDRQKMEYINGIECKLNRYQSYYNTGNTFIDNLLHAKKLEALDKKIEFKVFADFTPFKQIKNEDLCVMISNTVDNALRECQLMKKEEPAAECLIQLKARKIKGFLSILCENSLRESQAEFLQGNLTLETSKKDKKNHGFGVKNIRSVVKDYGGEVSFCVVDHMFSVSVIIPVEV